MNSPSIILPSEISPDEDYVHGRTHGLEDCWLTSRLVPWFHVETLDPRVWVCVLTTGGKWIYWTKDGHSEPDIHKRDYARTVVRYLNKHCHFDGAWVGAWTDGWQTFYLLWKDRDGDIQFPIDSTLPWRELRGWAPDVWGKQASAAHEIWRDSVKVLELKAEQTRKLAQGQH